MGGEARTLDWLWLIKAVCRRCGHIRERMMLLSSTEMLFGHSHSLCFFTLFLLSLSFFSLFPLPLSISLFDTLFTATPVLNNPSLLPLPSFGIATPAVSPHTLLPAIYVHSQQQLFSVYYPVLFR